MCNLVRCQCPCVKPHCALPEWDNVSLVFPLLSGSEEPVLSICPKGASSLHCTFSPHLRLGLTFFSLLRALYHLLLYQRKACPHPSPKDKGGGPPSGLEGSVEPVAEIRVEGEWPGTCSPTGGQG